MKKKIFLSLLTSSILVAQTIELEPLNITSTAIKTDELKSTDAVEIYTAEDIQNAHVQNVYEFLNQQTSVIAMPSYGNSFSQKLDFRGYGINDGYQNIVITLNGRKINNIDMVPSLLSSISPSSIERLEIIKSSGIVNSGDGANAGAINIITKKNRDKEITLYGGSVIDGSFYLGHSNEKLSISANAEIQNSDGIRTINSNGDKDESSLKSADFHAAYAPIEDLELRAGISYARMDLIYASYLTLDEYNDDPKQAGAANWGATEQEFDTDTINGGFSYYLSDNLSLNIDASREEKESNYITYASVADYVYNSGKAAFNYENKNIAVVAGIDSFEGKRRAYENETSKDNLAGFVISNFMFKSHSIKAGMRVEEVSYKYRDTTLSLKDDHSLYGAELGYNYTFNKENSLFINYAHSYQAPDIDRFFNKEWSGNVSFNGFIDPMQTDSFTLGYNNIHSNNKFKISLFYIDLKDEIYLSPLTWTNTNIDKSYKYGLDIYNKWLVTDEFNIALNYNYVRAIIDEEGDYSGNDLPGVSDHNIKATLSYLPNKNITLALTQVYRSEAYAADDFNNDFAQKQEAYKSTDVSLTYTKDSLELFAKINNLFNQKNGLWIRDDAIYPVNFTTTATAGFKLKL
ncbi:TonB-dependent receptor [Sulfurimonas xiamenensis]|uniref:TonB-dependent receptor n=1 Tax=Sulfurimonas xiamenensis TaxID=2590021 RepID=A0AAJ4A251_9BACT|nr:TonB-dependent receptor [Sulfurimonas xiamenensis]QFR42479.1 TonB-dependent receptor [Sulfurimonas xiamenensis]